jgi:hypothetical protein
MMSEHRAILPIQAEVTLDWNLAMTALETIVGAVQPRDLRYCHLERLHTLQQSLLEKFNEKREVKS